MSEPCKTCGEQQPCECEPCPRCGRLIRGPHELGVFAHLGTVGVDEGCGWCSHPSKDREPGGVWTCGICSRALNDDGTEVVWSNASSMPVWQSKHDDRARKHAELPRPLWGPPILPPLTLGRAPGFMQMIRPEFPRWLTALMQFYADEWALPGSVVLLQDGAQISVIATPAVWGQVGAVNLARAYRPEVP